MNYLKTIKKSLIVIILVAFTFVLSSCKSNKVPYGSLTDAVYASIDNQKVTEKELYNELRLQSLTIFGNYVAKIDFKDEIVLAKEAILSGDEDACKFFNEKIASAVFSTTDGKAINDTYEKRPESFYTSICKFVDNLFLINNRMTADREDIVSALYAILPSENADGEWSVPDYSSVGEVAGYNVFNMLYDNYGTDCGKWYYAKTELPKDILDEDSMAYINEENDASLVSYYKANKQGKYNVSAFIVTFINLNEANAALHLANLKSDSRGYWYQIPDIRTILEADYNSTDYAHVKKIIQGSGADDKGLQLTPDFTKPNNGFSISNYENYYNRYTINTSRLPADGLPDQALDKVQVLEKFVEISNLLDASRVLHVEGTTIMNELSEEYDVEFTYDKLTKLNTTIRDHIYKTLVALDYTPDDPDETIGNPYSARVQTAGSIRYLAYKLTDNSIEDKGILVDSKDESGNDIKIFNVNDDDPAIAQKAQEMKDKVRNEIIKGKLNSSYITSKATEKTKDRKINIYDPLVREYYKNQAEYKGSNKFKNNDTFGTVGDTTITVDEFFAELEKAYGINIALDMLVNKWLESSPYASKITADDKKGFDEQFENMIAAFSSDQYASSGYPASMGRKNFLLLAFGASNDKEAKQKLYVQPKLRELFYADYEALYGSEAEGNTIYDKLAQLVALQHDNFKSITTSHLLIYFDKNNDGTPDDPEEFLSELTPEKRVQVEKGLVKLVELVLDNAQQFVGYVQGFTKIATDFQTSGRIERGSKYDPTIELFWSEYRKLGFNLKYEAISSAITNSSNIPLSSNSSILDKVYYNKAISIFNILTDKVHKDPLDPDSELVNPDIELPYLDIAQNPNNAFMPSWDHNLSVFGPEFDLFFEDNLALLNEVKSAFGYHLILATAFSEATSAEYSKDDDVDSLYTNDDGLNCYNENNEETGMVASKNLTASQIKYYLKEQATAEGVSLPSVVQTAVSNYLSPILNRFKGDYMKRELIFKELAALNVTFGPACANGAARFAAIREINIKQLNEYCLSSNPNGIYDAQYAALYGTWFDILEA